ncbi:MAG: PAS domain S-box protein [Polyangiales bacterium]
MQGFQRFIEAAPDAMVVVARDGRIAMVNTQAETLFGYGRDEMLGQPIEMLLPLARREAHAGHRERYTSAPSVRPMGSGLKLSCRRRDGVEVPVEVSLSPLDADVGPVVVAAIRDVSERHRMEEALRRASAAKSEFLSSMSHELRTPLHAILGFASLLRRDRAEPLSERQREMVDHILKGGDHLLRLVNEVLDLARIESGRVALSLEPVAVSHVMSEALNTLEPLAQRSNITLAGARGDAAVDYVVMADRTRLTQVLLNLGSNAIKYGREGGNATFSVARAEDGWVRLAVRDDGVGIDPGRRDEIFVPFQRAGQETGAIEGTGIGLALSRRLAELMGGRMGFDSAPGQGSVFWVELPEHARVDALPAVKPASVAAVDGPPRDVVYIEDNPANVAFMRALLAELPGARLHVAGSAELGLELVRALVPRAVILDVNLPGMSGLEAARVLKAHPETRGVPLIGLSAAPLKQERRGTRRFDHYFTKPVDVASFSALMSELLK